MSQHAVCCGPMFWVYLMSCVGLVMFAGLMSGLTLGLMSLSLVDLEVLAKAGTPTDKDNAARILPVVKNQHLLLCTLLIGNSLAMEALPIFLDSLVPSFGAILISVTLILAFGEIMPQAICTRYGLSVGAKAAPVVRILLIVFFPVAYPISKLLDWVLGKGHVALMRRAELKTLVDMHGNEVDFILILLCISGWQRHTMGMIMTKGHSRVPIYSGSPNNIIGLILVKNLITCQPEDEVPIRNVTIRKIPRVSDDLPLYDILNEFQKGHSHMAVVVRRIKEAGASIEKTYSDRSDYKTNSDRSDYKINHRDAHADEIIICLALADQLKIPLGLSPSRVSIAGSRRNNIEKNGEVRLYKKSEKKRDNILDFNSGPLPSYPLDEEAVGIITMEDVMEQLLQVGLILKYSLF
uniref:CNNM transmembrane domain-containing protein n=1 Tax=Oryza punctata TaxID=4537 RepID=A0A0E0K865_ORYPU